MRLPLLLSLLASLSLVAQSEPPLIPTYGTVYPAPDAALRPDPNQKHRIVFDLASDERKDGVNNGLWYLARLRNLLAAADVPADSVELVGVLHGGATALALSPEAHSRRTDGDPSADLALMATLSEHQVEFYVCAQSALGQGIDVDTELNGLVTPALSAMTTLVVLQERGFVAF